MVAKNIKDMAAKPHRSGPNGIKGLAAFCKTPAAKLDRSRRRPPPFSAGRAKVATAA